MEWVRTAYGRGAIEKVLEPSGDGYTAVRNRTPILLIKYIYLHLYIYIRLDGEVTSDFYSFLYVLLFSFSPPATENIHHLCNLKMQTS